MTLKNYQLKTIIKVVAIGVFSLSILIYVILKTQAVSTGVKLHVEGISDGAVYSESTLLISGNAARAKHLLVNGREIFINQTGDFSDTLVLSPGYNIMTIEAEDKFGTITKETFEVILQTPKEISN